MPFTVTLLVMRMQVLARAWKVAGLGRAVEHTAQVMPSTHSFLSQHRLPPCPCCLLPLHREVYTLGGGRGPSTCYYVPTLSAFQVD